ncbi:MAG: ergothioneine biosynthesis protein EgtB [Planctomycetes bacterium]|nr:ergothioneine biosynthesis protein EgtB [Planctomycetota bacterium]
MNAPDPRLLRGDDLVQALRTARAATLAACLDLTDAQWRVPIHPSIQPTAWDLMHIGWFTEFWCLRGPHRIGSDGFLYGDRPPRHFGPDAHLDSARIVHQTRWEIPLLERTELCDRLRMQLDDCAAHVRAAGDSDEALYHARFAVYHELMHVEALLWTRALLGYPAPPGYTLPHLPRHGELPIAATTTRIGWPDDEPGFAFDNERGGRKVELPAFAIDDAPVTNGEFLQFVLAGGYDHASLWPGRAGVWLARKGRRLPERWRRGADSGFEQRWFERWLPLDLAAPVIHVNAWEAEAWCRFAGRRLPTAAEWEVAARQLRWGQTVWEWTADPFAPYPNFRPAPYSTYSAPWFHHQREMRGGAFATHPLMHHRRYRNFFLPQRTDIFGGFRSARDV